MTMTKTKSLLLILLGSALTCCNALAKEGGDQSAPGPESWAAGAAPPPGLYYLNYSGGYHGTLKDGSGNNVSLAGSTPSVDAVFDCARFVLITPKQVLGGNIGMHTIIPFVYQSANMANLGGSKSVFNIGDIDINPFFLSWHSKNNVHVMSGVDIYAPTGHYEQSDPRTSIGANYWSFEPQLILSYFTKTGWDYSARLMENVKKTNQPTQYHSGQEFHADYLVGKHIGQWGLGIDGYALKQLGDDTVNGSQIAAAPGFWSAGRRGQVVALGPSVDYTTKNHIIIIGMYQHEMAVQNRFGGDKFWFRLIIPTGKLAPHKKS